VVLPYRTILLALDGSFLAERAIRYAEHLARLASARLILLRAVEAYPSPSGDALEAEIAAVQQGEEYLEAVEEQLNGSGAAPLTVERKVVYGSAGEAILDAVRQQRPDLLVMATHGLTGLRRLLYGSVSDHVLRHVAVPLLLVPAWADMTWEHTAPRRMLVPLDGSSFAEQALEPASQLARVLGAGIVLLRVVGNAGVSENDQEPSNRAPRATGTGPTDAVFEARRSLDGYAAWFQRAGHTVEIEVEAGAAAETIARVAARRNVDAIAMATHGRSGVARVVLGSVAGGTLQRAQAPLLLVRVLPLSGEHA
jgi:nucleotide-binding universal stress UspA family protein